MRILLISLTFILTSCCYSQKTSGKVIYSKEFILKKTTNSNQNSKKNLIKDAVFKMMTEGAENLEYELIFNKNKSYFKYKENLNVGDTKSKNLAVRMNGGSGSYYVDKKKNIVIRKLQEIGETFLISNKFNSPKWKLINETKIIGSYKCYKAITSISVQGVRRIYTHEMTAWYCIDIPVPFGPIGFGNLPGLIIELNYNNKAIYKMKTIQFVENNEDLVIKKPVGGKNISKDEYNKIVRDMIKKRLNR